MFINKTIKRINKLKLDDFSTWVESLDKTKSGEDRFGKEFFDVTSPNSCVIANFIRDKRVLGMFIEVTVSSIGMMISHKIFPYAVEVMFANWLADINQ